MHFQPLEMKFNKEKSRKNRGGGGRDHLVQVSRAENVILNYRAAVRCGLDTWRSQLKAQHGTRGHRGECTCVMPLTHFTIELNSVSHSGTCQAPGGSRRKGSVGLRSDFSRFDPRQERPPTLATLVRPRRKTFFCGAKTFL